MCTYIRYLYHHVRQRRSQATLYEHVSLSHVCVYHVCLPPLLLRESASKIEDWPHTHIKGTHVKSFSRESPEFLMTCSRECPKFQFNFQGSKRESPSLIWVKKTGKLITRTLERQTCQKRPVRTKRDLFICQMGPPHVSKDTNL